MSGDLAEKVSRAMCCGNSCLAPDEFKCCHGIYKETAKAAIRVVAEECARLAEEPLAIDFGRQSSLKINKRHDKIASDICALLGDGE